MSEYTASLHRALESIAAEREPGVRITRWAGFPQRAERLKLCAACLGRRCIHGVCEPCQGPCTSCAKARARGKA